MTQYRYQIENHANLFCELRIQKQNDDGEAETEESLTRIPNLIECIEYARRGYKSRDEKWEPTEERTENGVILTGHWITID